jgi:hypothetical protein
MKLNLHFPLPSVEQEDIRRSDKANEKALMKIQRKSMDPTEEATIAKKEKEKQTLGREKAAMKRQKKGAVKATEKEKEAEQGDDRREGETKSSKTKQLTKRARKPRKSAAPQGRRKVPTPGDASGCKHRGLRELDVCDKVWIAAYVKVGAWLHKKPCIDCAAKGEDGEETGERVLDASVLLLLKQPSLAYICNCGPIGHKMEEGEEGRDEYQCDMMLCLPCYSTRDSLMTEVDGNKRRRRQRTTKSC